MSLKKMICQLSPAGTSGIATCYRCGTSKVNLGMKEPRLQASVFLQGGEPKGNIRTKSNLMFKHIHQTNILEMRATFFPKQGKKYVTTQD